MLETKLSSKNETGALFAILILAAAVRLIGINYDLPHIYNPDDHRFVDTAYKILSNVDLNPHWFGHPGSFIIYILVALGAFVSFIQYIYFYSIGETESLSQFIQQLRYNHELTPATFHFIGRFMIVFMAVGCVWLTFKIAKNLFNEKVGLISALLLAIAPLHVNWSRYFRTDIPSSFFILLAIYLLLKYLDDKSKIKCIFWAAFCAGISVANKYTSGVVLFPIIIVSISQDYKDLGFKRLVCSSLLIRTLTAKLLLLFFFGFFIFAPFVIIDFKNAIYWMKVEARTYHFGFTGAPGLNNYLWYITNPLLRGFGGFIFLSMAVLGFVNVIRRLNFKLFVSFLFPVLYFVAVGLSPLRWSRWMLVIIPFQAILASLGISLFVKLTRNDDRKMRVLGYIVTSLLIFCLGSVLLRNINICKSYLSDDSRTNARIWIESNIPEKSKIAHEGRLRLNVNNTKGYELERFSPYGIITNHFDYYKQNGFEYIIILQEIKNRYSKEPDRYPDAMKQYEQIEQKCILLHTVSGEDVRGPTIYIYKLLENNCYKNHEYVQKTL